MRVIVVGEGMIELRAADDGWCVGYGGDTLNMALHFARFGRDVAVLTALGTDPFSDGMRRAWAGEGVDTSLILTDPERSAGLYAIRVDDAGERSFTYWRSDSAARRLFALDGTAHAVDRAAAADLLCLSLVSLAILPPAGREALFDLCHRVRARGGRVSFDGNYRPALWRSVDEARDARDAAIACCDIGLPTLEDEVALGRPAAPERLAAEWHRLGAAELVVKLGTRGCFVDGEIVAPLRAAALGHALAGWVVMRPGAIPVIDPAAPYGRSPATSFDADPFAEAGRCR